MNMHMLYCLTSCPIGSTKCKVQSIPPWFHDIIRARTRWKVFTHDMIEVDTHEVGSGTSAQMQQHHQLILESCTTRIWKECTTEFGTKEYTTRIRIA